MAIGKDSSMRSLNSAESSLARLCLVLMVSIGESKGDLIYPSDYSIYIFAIF